jgi:hypothetical protein
MHVTPQLQIFLLLGVHERTIMSVLGWSTTAMASRYTHVLTQIHSDLASGPTASGDPAETPQSDHLRQQPRNTGCQVAAGAGVWPGQTCGGGGI